MAEHKGEQGTGKHPHKDTAEPYPHHEASGTKSDRSGSQSSSQSRSSQSESSDLKSREYRDEHGNIHHHTHTAGESKE